MGPKLYIGNLSYELDEPGLEQVFSTHGKLKSVKIITDRDTGRSRGFGFVEYESADEAATALDATDGKDAGGRPLKVSFAKERV